MEIQIHNFIHDRLDISIKIAFIKAYKTGINYDFNKKLYLKHIKCRISFQEDLKQNENDFLTSFIKLIDSVESIGFDSRFPIHVNVDGKILSGAHRLACCKYFNKVPTCIEKIGTFFSWDYTWFLNNNFTQKERIMILENHQSLFGGVCSVVYYKNSALSQKCINYFHDKKLIIARERIKFQSLIPVIDEIYSYNSLDTQFLAQEKGGILNYHAKYVDILLLRDIDEVDLMEIKRKLRESYDEQDKYLVLHTPQDTGENQHLLNTFLHYSTVLHLQLRKVNCYSQKLIRNLKELAGTLKKHDISQYCIAGGSCLDIFGEYQSSDIDIILGGKTKKNIKETSTSYALNKNIDVVASPYFSHQSDLDTLSDISNIFYFKGFPFLNLNLIREKKMNSTREKDRNSIKYIDEVLSGRLQEEKNIIKTIKQELYYLRIKFSAKTIRYIIYITQKLGIYKLISFFWRKYYLKR